MKPVRLSLLLLLAALPLSARTLDLPRANEKWSTLRVDEFEIVSNASPSATKAIAEDLLRMRDALGRVTHMKVRSPLRTTVFVFTNERAFAPYRDAVFQRKADGVGGVFLGGENGNFILLRADTSDGVDRLVFHELTHYFVRNTVPGLPLWLNEALAEYYSSFRTSGGEVHIGRPISEHVLWLRDEKLIPLAQLFAVDHNSPIYNESSRRGVFYAQSWALLHYLMLGENQERREQLTNFLRLLGSGKRSDDAFNAAFGIPYEKMEQDLRQYVRKRVFPYMKYSLSEIAPVAIPKPEPMPHAALLYELGHLLAYTDRANAADAERFLHAALQANPQLAAAHADLGRLHELAGRRGDAEDAYERAVTLGSSNADVYLLSGIAVVNRLAGRIDPPQADVLKARRLFQRATELDPQSARAWAGYGATFSVTTDDPAPGIAALEKSRALAPGDDDTVIYLAQLYSRAGRLSEGLALAQALVKRTTDPRVAQFTHGLIGRIEAQAIGKALNEAIDKANAGKNAEALALVDALLPKITDAAMLEEAKSFRDQLAERTKRKR